MKHLDYRLYSELLQYVSSESEANVDTFYQSTCMPLWQGKILGINEEVPNELLSQCEFSSMDFSLGLYMSKIDLPVRQMSIQRAASCRSFSERKMSFLTLMSGLSQALCADKSGRREYSSAGGLYSVEVFVALQSERLSNAPDDLQSGYYYLDSNQQKLVLISPSSSESIRRALMSEDSYFMPAAFQIITIINTPKSLFKYRERGFRNSLIEVGSIHHVLRDVFVQHGVDSCESAEFYDPLVLDSINLNKRIFKACLVQHFGYKTC